MSVCRIHIKLANKAPHIPKDTKTKVINLLVDWKKKHLFTKYKPYPPSFNKIPAKIIEPAKGASTCALGNQRCTEYMGSFTKKAPYRNIIKISLEIELHEVLIICMSKEDIL